MRDQVKALAPIWQRFSGRRKVRTLVPRKTERHPVLPVLLATSARYGRRKKTLSPGSPALTPLTHGEGKLAGRNVICQRIEILRDYWDPRDGS